MHRTVLVLRHGHAHDGGPADDLGRELRDKGKRNAQRMGVWLARNGLLPDHTIASHATRARRTAEKCVKTAGLRGDLVAIDERVYGGDAGALLAVLADVPETARTVLVVGHNPGLEELLRTLAGDPGPRDDAADRLGPGCLVHLRVSRALDALGEGCAEVVTRVHPKSLPRLFPFPGLDGAEERTRPAYYYRQSSVVPFRRRDGQLEVLVVSSSKRKHWVIPKGIHDPGVSAQDSAAKEAFEEAGVEGTVLDRVIGSYRYPKWDATCEVEVYPMSVSHVLPAEQWEERHRGRRWASVAEAASMVLNDDVKRLVASLPDALGDEPGNGPDDGG